jgi:hypothetical protein
MDSLRIGSQVILFHPKGALGIITHIARTLVQARTEMVEFHPGLLLTAWHPVFGICGECWEFPAKCSSSALFKSSGPASNYSSRYVYSLCAVNLLKPAEPAYGIIAGNIPVITLGHEQSIPVLIHPYYGTSKVLDDLVRVECWRKAQ